MSDMIERVARALCVARGQDPVYAKHWMPEARTAIAAMREPTEAIIRAHHLVPDDNDFDKRAADNWRNLIDAALKAE